MVRTELPVTVIAGAGVILQVYAARNRAPVAVPGRGEFHPGGRCLAAPLLDGKHTCHPPEAPRLPGRRHRYPGIEIRG